MSGFRAYCENLKNVAPEDVLCLSADESRHLCGALRARVGDAVDAFDLSGLVANSEICEANTRAAKLKVRSVSTAKSRASRVILAQALPKGKTFDDIISLCVQIGISAIYPIVSEHCVVRLEARDSKRKLEKWRQQLIEAVKQSANMSAPEIMEPMGLSEFLSRSESFEGIAKFVASLDAKNPDSLLRALCCGAKDASGACVLIGCEGDFSKREYEAAYAKNFTPVTLGDNVLKCDVAAAYSMSLCSAFFADKSGF